MTLDPDHYPKVLMLYLALNQYPILAPSIRERMRTELFQKGVISPENFEQEVREKAIASQEREGLMKPGAREADEVWQIRTKIVRDNLTDFYFAYNIPYQRFEEIVKEIVSQGGQTDEIVLTIHPELAPWDMLFAQGEAYEVLPEVERGPVQHHLEEIKVVLIKAMISDHLQYIAIAKDWFDISHLQTIRSLRIGRGKIGGKAAGVMLADTILRKSAPEEIVQNLRIPRSWFLGADVFYQFIQMNQLFHYANQKYKSEREIQDDFPVIRESFKRGVFPEDILADLRLVLENAGKNPLIVRSSSLLEDSFGASFAGKYETHFCPNQSSLEENLNGLTDAIAKVYASVYNPDALLYRQRMGLSDYDERMAVLIQEVQGRESEGTFFPDAAGVAFSRNQFRWSPRIERSAGFVRMVWGLGTRAVEHLGQDYPRLVALSHPDLRPVSTPQEIRHYSQVEIDLIDLTENKYKTMRVSDTIRPLTPFIQYIAQLQQGDQLQDIVGRPVGIRGDQFIITFDGLLSRTDFPRQMRTILSNLEAAYTRPVDMEFAAELIKDSNGKTTALISILQCRPQSYLEDTKVKIPDEVPVEDIVFVTKIMVPHGHISNIRYIVQVDERGYAALGSSSERIEIARLIGRLNRALSRDCFILIGPGRWGSNNPDLGVSVTYSDIYRSKALIEMSFNDEMVEPSYGTHFFQDLVEADIFPITISLSEPGTQFNQGLLHAKENFLPNLLPEDRSWKSVVSVFDLDSGDDKTRLEIVMDGDSSTAMGFLVHEPEKGIQS